MQGGDFKRYDKPRPAATRDHIHCKRYGKEDSSAMCALRLRSRDFVARILLTRVYNYVHV